MPATHELPRIGASEIRARIRKLTEPIMQRARLLGILKAKGRLVMNASGGRLEWPIRYRRNTPVAQVTYPVAVQFDLPNRITTAWLPWRQYMLTEAITKKEVLAQKDSNMAFPRLVDHITEWMMDDFQFYFQRVLYADGESGAYDIHGLESFFSYNGLVSGGKVGNPNDTYATISTSLGALGGTCTGTWPEGQCSVEYCAWSPIIVDRDQTDFKDDSTAASSWSNNWRKAVRYGRAMLVSKQGIDPDVMITSPNVLYQMKNVLDAKVTLEVTQRSSIVDLGIPTLNFEGVEVVDDAFCPDDTIYMFPSSKVTLYSMQAGLVDMDESVDPYKTRLFVLDFHGQLRCDSPAFFVKILPISS